ncbi:MAG: hypothetical protein RL088_3556 [Verrucomicrobiota bacterium]|jgi:hypothetical protein
MKTPKLIIAAAAAVLSTVTAQADVVIHITGSTAFRSGTITAIQTLMGGTGNFKAAYGSTTGTGTTSSNRSVIQGSIASVPSAGVVTFKCSWSGSTGGIKTVVQNLDVTTWPSIANLPATNTTVGIADASLNFALDTGTFPGETAKADVTMEDTTQAATGFTTTTLTEIRVGVIPFEWVSGNQSPAALNNITPLQAQAAVSGGAPLSLFTGNPTDVNQVVYVVGRNFDSGTRLCFLTNSGLSPFASVQHVQAIVSGTAGQAGSSITGLKLYQAETILGQSFTIGNSGYSSGSFVADLLATPGASTAATSGAGIPAAEQLLFGPGHLIGFLGRSDAARACRTSVIGTNTAKRMKFNGVQIWNEPILSTGVPTSYNDDLIKEGVYTLWEFQNLAYRQSYSGPGKLVADALAAEITANVPTTSGIKLSDMHVTKSVEGGVVTSTQL